MKILKINLVKYFILFTFLSSCSVAKRIEKDLIKQSEINNYFRGFVVYDTKLNKEVLNYNGNKYFTPASNTKLFTFYSAYKTFNDSVVGLEYYKAKDSIIIKGTGDPSFLYGFDENRTLKFLNNVEDSIYLIDEKINDNIFGDGWSWDDYTYYYMPEKNLFPIFGNIISVSSMEDSLIVNPSFFTDFVHKTEYFKPAREYNTNQFFVNPYKINNSKEIPFVTSNKLTADLLSKELHKKVVLIHEKPHYNYQQLYSVAYDSLYKRMLTVSDNFIAEQLMLQVGNKTKGNYKVLAGINYSLNNYLKNIPQKPKWVDGSGLSRYNLFTPESFVFVLKKMLKEIPKDKLFYLMPARGKSGTLKNFFTNNKPYIYAKTGSLSNNFNLSGYLITKKGRVLIFSFMNNHYMASATKRKEEMEKIFRLLYEKY